MPGTLARAVAVGSSRSATLWSMTNTQRAKGDRSTVVAAFAVLATVIALIVTTWFTNKANREQLRVTEDGQITDRYSAAVDQLGHLDLDVRLGGIYALERIMRDSEPDQATIVAVLFAYVRDQTRPDRSCPEGLDHPATDVQAALTVVGRRDAKRDNNRVKSDLSGACLIGADLSGADLTGVAMIGTDLTCAHLMGANLHRAKITSTQMGAVNLTNATLTEAPCDWRATTQGRSRLQTVTPGHSPEHAVDRRASPRSFSQADSAGPHQLSNAPISATP